MFSWPSHVWCLKRFSAVIILGHERFALQSIQSSFSLKFFLELQKTRTSQFFSQFIQSVSRLWDQLPNCFSSFKFRSFKFFHKVTLSFGLVTQSLSFWRYISMTHFSDDFVEDAVYASGLYNFRAFLVLQRITFFTQSLILCSRYNSVWSSS